MNGLSVMKRTASTSSSIFAVSSAITSLLGKPLIIVSEGLIDPLPTDGLAATIDQGALVGTGDLHLFGRGPRDFFQRDRLVVGWQAIMRRPIERGEGLELVEGVLLLEDLRIGLDRDRRVEHTGNAAGRNFLRIGMRRGIGAEEIAGFTGRCGFTQRQAIALG